MIAIQRLPPPCSSERAAAAGRSAMSRMAAVQAAGSIAASGAQLRSRRDRDEDVLARERDAVAQVTAPWQLVDGAAEHAERAGEAGRDRIGRGEECGRHLSTAPSRGRRRPGRTRPSCSAAASLAR